MNPEMLDPSDWAELDRKAYSDRSFKVGQGECTLEEFGVWVRDTLHYLEGRKSKKLSRKELRRERVEAYVELCSSFRLLEMIPGAAQHRLISTVRFNLGLLLESVGQFVSCNFNPRHYHVQYMRALADAVQQACIAK